MKLTLKPFQEAAASAVLDEIAESREAVLRGKLQAVVLSAPTGSGKTVTVASVIEQTLGGGEGVPARPHAVFLWLSDSPELNVQSKAKLVEACDNLPFHRMITIDSDNFDEERLLAGNLYFINTQLLGKDKRLTQAGDKRRFTFWQTVANTVKDVPNDFVLIIDEAHRGAATNDRTRVPIMQKFILGSPIDALPPVPLVLGMSATPQRFTGLLGNTNRTQRPIVITPDDVRSSGLLKDMIVVHNPTKSAETDLTMLQEASRRLSSFSESWKQYCEDEREVESVKPLLVIQVRDGTDKTITKTNLDDVVRVVEREVGPLAINEIVHCFQDKGDISAGERTIRHIDASRIQQDHTVRVVLFKTALNTGWDCPRAEVMMSFRTAQDPTTIAQLVGRMVRTPLARRIERNEVLNTVDLFLPHYDAAALATVLEVLRTPDTEDSVPARVEVHARTYLRNPAFSAVFDRLEKLPNYTVARAPKIGSVKRALRLAGLLVHEGIDPAADEHLRNELTEELNRLRDSLAKTGKGWERTVRQGGEIEVDVTVVATGGMRVENTKKVRLVLSPENVEHLFDAAGRVLASGEGLHRTYWKRFHSASNPDKAKLELFALVRESPTLSQLETLADERFASLWDANKSRIGTLPASDRVRFEALIQAGGRPHRATWDLPYNVVEVDEGQQWKAHLFVDEKGLYRSPLNTWETTFLEKAMSEPGFVCWLRNLPRREWALSIPYELGGIRACYPDFVVVKKVKSSYEVDLLEPHDDKRTDTWAKAKGMAKYADEHGVNFGKILIGRLGKNGIETVDLNNAVVRKRALKMTSANDLESLFS